MSVVNFLSDKMKKRFEKACANGKIANSERVLSIIAGGFIMAYSGKRILHSPISSLPGVAIGAGLVVRGITGKCPVKGAIKGEPEQEYTIVEHRYFVK